MIMQSDRTLVYALSFSSGFSIMGIELLGGRILAPYFGSSIHIWGSIITVFMLSLSIGYLIGGKLSAISSSLKYFAYIFLLGGAFILPIVLFANTIMETIFVHVEDTRYGSLLAASCLFLIPTLILGMISPYAVRLLVKDTNESGKVAGYLYFVSTLGSALGTIITSFYLVLFFEVNQIILSFSIVLLSLGAFTLLFYGLRQTPHIKEVKHV